MAKERVVLRPITAQEMRNIAVEAQINVPIEQTWVWAEFEETFPDRSLVGFFSIVSDKKPVAILGLTRGKYHGFEFVWAKHGPVWLVAQTEELERLAVDAIVNWIKERRSRTAFVRLHLRYPQEYDTPSMQIVSHDRTVIVDLTGGHDQILSRMKPRMRTQLRAYIRRTPLDITDETLTATSNFGSYYEVLGETADRQEFTPWSSEVYENLLRVMDLDHARLYAARHEGELVAWTIITLAGTEASYYYAASTDAGREMGAPAQLLLHAFVELGQEGYQHMDLVGIGSDRAPSLTGLTPFKSGFSKETVEVSSSYDIPVNRVLFRLLTGMKTSRNKVKSLSSTITEKIGKGEKGD